MSKRLGEMDAGSAAERGQMFGFKERIKKIFTSALIFSDGPLKHVLRSSESTKARNENRHFILSLWLSLLSYLGILRTVQNHESKY